MSAKAVQGAVQVLALVMFFIIVLGVTYFVREQFEALGLPWPSALDTTLSVLVGFVELIMTPPDIRKLVALIAVFIIALGLLLRLGGPGAGR
jgi:Na+-driven multidrug efflux pump